MWNGTRGGPPQDTLYIGGQDTRMQAFKVPFLMDVAPSAHQLARHSIGDDLL